MISDAPMIGSTIGNRLIGWYRLFISRCFKIVDNNIKLIFGDKIFAISVLKRRWNNMDGAYVSWHDMLADLEVMLISDRPSVSTNRKGNIG